MTSGKAPKSRLTPQRKLLFMLIPLLSLLIGGELITRAVYFQQNAEHPVGIIWLIRSGQGQVRGYRDQQIAATLAADIEAARKRAMEEVEAEDETSEDAKADSHNEQIKKVYSAEEEKLNSPAEQKKLYSRVFAAFVKECEERNILLHVVHPRDYWTSKEDADFFASLAAEHGIGFSDLGDTFNSFPPEVPYLLPLDSHLSAFGAKLTADALVEAIKPSLDHRSRLEPDLIDTLWGDHFQQAEPLQTNVIPFMAVLTPEALRENLDVKNGSENYVKPASTPRYSLEKDPKRARILCIGDSMTYGSFLHGGVTISAWLARLLPEAEVINAGVPGYSICDEYEYLIQRGIKAAPDIVILQVLNNDLYALTPTWREQFCRHRRGQIGGEPGEFCFQE